MEATAPTTMLAVAAAVLREKPTLWRDGAKWQGSMWRAAGSRPHVAFGHNLDDEDEES